MDGVPREAGDSRSGAPVEGLDAVMGRFLHWSELGPAKQKKTAKMDAGSAAKSKASSSGKLPPEAWEVSYEEALRASSYRRPADLAAADPLLAEWPATPVQTDEAMPARDLPLPQVQWDDGGPGPVPFAEAWRPEVRPVDRMAPEALEPPAVADPVSRPQVGTSSMAAPNPESELVQREQIQGRVAKAKRQRPAPAAKALAAEAVRSKASKASADNSVRLGRARRLAPQPLQPLLPAASTRRVPLSSSRSVVTPVREPRVPGTKRKAPTGSRAAKATTGATGRVAVAQPGQKAKPAISQPRTTPKMTRTSSGQAKKPAVRTRSKPAGRAAFAAASRPATRPATRPARGRLAKPARLPEIKVGSKRASELDFRQPPRKLREAAAPEARRGGEKPRNRRGSHPGFGGTGFRDTGFREVVKKTASSRGKARRGKASGSSTALALRVSQEDQAHIEACAAQANLPVSAYLRQCALGVNELRSQVAMVLAEFHQQQARVVVEPGLSAIPGILGQFTKQCLRRLRGGTENYRGVPLR